MVYACSELPRTKMIAVAGLIFYNQTASPVHNATLRVSKTHGLVACGVILSGKSCSTTFPRHEYQGNPIIVTWEQAGHTWSSGEFYVQLPDAQVTEAPTLALVTLEEHGTIHARLVPRDSSQPSQRELQPQLR